MSLVIYKTREIRKKISRRYQNPLKHIVLNKDPILYSLFVWMLHQRLYVKAKEPKTAC